MGVGVGGAGAAIVRGVVVDVAGGVSVMGAAVGQSVGVGVRMEAGVRRTVGVDVGVGVKVGDTLGLRRTSSGVAKEAIGMGTGVADGVDGTITDATGAGISTTFGTGVFGRP